MNVLIVASKFPPEYSGPGVRIPRLYEAIGEELGVKTVEVACNGIEQPFNEDYEFKGWTVKRRVVGFVRKRLFLPSKITNSLAYFAETLQGLLFLRDYKNVDYMHIIGHSGMTAAALWWANKRNIPVMIELVTEYALPCQKFLFFGKVCSPKNSAIVTFRSDTEKKCRSLGFDEQIWKRPNPIDQDMYCLEPDRKQSLRSKHTPFDSEDIVISTVAKLMPQKNQVFLIEAIKELPERYKLVIAGPRVTDGSLLERDQAYFDQIAGKVAEYGLDSRVHIVADYVDSSEFMKLADIYALPAYNEGFATPMIEAIACGLPVVANSGEYAFGEWIRDGENGFLCGLEPQDWAEAVEKAARFPDEQKRIESENITKVAGQKNIYKTYVDLINRLTSKTST